MKQKYYDTIMKILLTYDEQEIKKLLDGDGFTEDKMLFSINKLDNGKYDVTLGFNSYGEDVCSKELDKYMDAYKFVAIRTLLGYKPISY